MFWIICFWPVLNKQENGFLLCPPLFLILTICSFSTDLLVCKKYIRPLYWIKCRTSFKCEHRNCLYYKESCYFALTLLRFKQCCLTCSTSTCFWKYMLIYAEWYSTYGQPHPFDNPRNINIELQMQQQWKLRMKNITDNILYWCILGVGVWESFPACTWAINLWT